MLWNLRIGAPWRDLPPDYGAWKNVHRCFCRWQDKGEWERLLELLVDEPDFEWLMIDASHVKMHPHATGAVGRNQDMERIKGGAQSQDTSGRGCELLVRIFVTAAATAGYKLGETLIEGIGAEYLLADGGYDTDAIINTALAAGMQAVIPSKKNRKLQHEYDEYLYKLRHLVENAFLHLKRW